MRTRWGSLRFLPSSACILAAGCVPLDHRCPGEKLSIERFEGFRGGGPELDALKQEAIRRAEAYNRLIDQLVLDGRDHDWAGTYLRESRDRDPKGALTTERILLASSGEFHASVCRSGCFLFFQETTGRALVSSETVTLLPEIRTDLGQVIDGEAPPVEYRLVRWGNRRYLVRAGEREAFRQAVLDGEEPRAAREGKFLLRCCDEKTAVAGSPSSGALRRDEDASPERAKE